MKQQRSSPARSEVTFPRLMLASPDQQISLTDPDSRSMATSDAAPAWSVTMCRSRSIPNII